MGSYGIGDVTRLLRVKAHVIRYWEQEVPLIRPRKDKLGKRYYSDRDIQILLRLKHLLYERHFTVEGAREELYRELAGDYQDLRAQIAALRKKLLDLYYLLKPGGAESPGDTSG
ncbi:MAG: MerR family transcriptional regulator [Treponema sp.]|jgi:DNA-binding transcriptional MerR regulator|nr:MerR family transcriptional regulator [Treponema sp.]